MRADERLSERVAALPQRVKGGGAEDAGRASAYPSIPADLLHRSSPPECANAHIRTSAPAGEAFQ